MVRIPRSEVTVEPRIAAQPDLAGSGWGEPGRAMQKLGAGIASLGDALGSLGGGGGKEADFNDKMALLKFNNEVDMSEINTQQNYNGDGTDYTVGRQDYFDTRANDTLANISPYGQQKAQLFIESKRGAYSEGAARFEGERRQGAMVSTTEDAITSEFTRAATAPPDQFDGAFNQAQQGIDRMINSAPLPESKKEALRAKAATIAEGLINDSARDDPEAALKVLPRVETLIQQYDKQPIDGGRIESAPAQELRDVGPQGQQQLNAPDGISVQDGDPRIAPSGPQSWLGQQGMLGSPSGATQRGPGQQGGQQFGQINFKDFSAGRTSFRALPARDVKNIILHDVSGSDPQKKAMPAPGHIPHYHLTFDSKGVYQEIPFDRQAPHARAYNKNSIGIAFRGYEGQKMTPDDIRHGAAAVMVVSEKFNIPPERILTHPGAGRAATKSGKDPKEASWRQDVLDYINKGGQLPEQQVARANQAAPQPEALQRKPGTIPRSVMAPQGGAQPNTQSIKAVASAYSPQRKGSPLYKMEGGYESAKQGPDGKSEVRTLEDFRTGRSTYVTIAGDDSEIGKKYRLAELTYTGKDGKSYTVKDVPIVVHDRGDAFVGKGDSRIDIPVDRDLTDAQMRAQPFSKQQIALIPEGQEGQEAQDLKSRSLTAVAGHESHLQPGREVQVADASGRFVPQQQPQPQSSVGSHLRERLLLRLPAYRRQFEGAVGTAIGMVETAAGKGYALPPEQFAAINAAVTKTGSADLRIRLDKAVAGLEVTQKLVRLRPEEVSQIGTAARANLMRNGILTATPDDIGRVEGIEKLAKSMREELENNSLAWGVRAGVIPHIEPLMEFNTIALRDRADAARVVAQHYGREPQFFMPEEREVLQKTLSAGGEKMTNQLGIMNEAFGPDMARAMREISKDMPEAASLGWLISAGGDKQAIKDAANAIALRASPDGEKIFKSLMPSADLARSTAVASLGSAFMAAPGSEQRAIDLANLVYTMRARDKGVAGDAKSFDEKLWTKGLNEVLGQTTDAKTGVTYGGLADQGSSRPTWLGGSGQSNYGVRTLVPANVRTDALPELVDALRVTDLVQGGMPEATPEVPLEISPEDNAAVARALQMDDLLGSTRPAQAPTAADLTALQTRGAPLDVHGRLLSVGALRRATLVSIGDGRYWLAMGDPTSADPQWVASNDTADHRYVLDLKALEPVLRERKPDAYLGGGQGAGPLDRPPGMMKLGGPKEGGAASEVTFGQVALDLVKRGVARDVETAKGILAPFKRLFTEGGWQRGPLDPQAANDMRDVLLATGVGASAVPRPAGSLGTFGGMKGADALAKAGERSAMERGGARRAGTARTALRDGETASDTWESAGWMRGKDAKMRMEIDDRNLRVNMDSFKNYETPPAGFDYMDFGVEAKDGLLYHPELAKAYPDLEYLTVLVKKTEPGAPKGGRAYLNNGTPIIEIHAPDATSARRIAVEELQHQVQGIEGFHVGRPGTHPDYKVAAGEVEAKNAVKRLDFTGQERRRNFPGDTQDVPFDKQVPSPIRGPEFGDALSQKGEQLAYGGKGEAGRKTFRHVDKTSLEVTAERLTREISEAEKALKGAGKTPKEIAQELNAKFDMEISADEIAGGEVWWRVPSKGSIEAPETPISARVGSDPLSQAERASVLSLADEGLGAGEIAHQLGIDQTKVGAVIASAKPHVPKPERNPKVPSRIENLFAHPDLEGLSAKEAADKLSSVLKRPVTERAIYRARQRAAAKGADLPKMAGRSAGPWSEDAMAAMKTATSEGLDAAQIAARLNKDFPAFEGKLTANGVRLRRSKAARGLRAGGRPDDPE